MSFERELVQLALELLHTNRKLDHFMTQTDDQIAAILAAQDAQTVVIGNIAQDVQTLQGEVADSGDAATAAKLQAVVDKLNASTAALSAIDDQTPNPAAPPVEPLPDGPPTV
jgi:hypothetical protein